MHLLLIEDDKEAARYLEKGLRESGHVVTVEHDGKSGLVTATTGQFDCLIVDRMLPELDGLALVKALRAAGNETPVLFLTALSQVDDRVAGLRAGGDDYLVKPYAFSELLARIDVLGKRRDTARSQAATTSLTCGDLELDLLARKVMRAGQMIDLKPREFKILEVLLRHQGQVVTRTMLLEQVWDYHFDPQTNVIDVHVSKLRQKIEKGFETTLIHTIRGAGYALRAEQS